MNIDVLDNIIRKELSPLFSKHEKTSFFNTAKVLKAFRENQVSDHYFAPASGYGYSGVGREALDRVFAGIFGTEAALVRSQFVSGTHAISTVLFALLQTGDELLAVTGAPYDTLQTVIGAAFRQKGSLTEHGIKYREIPLGKPGKSYLSRIKAAVTSQTRLAYIQRSRGYAAREALSISDIEWICAAVKRSNPQCVCFVDNCYGEFVEEQEPPEAGADIIAGSLIKNPGGGLAVSGGYIAGKKDLVEAAAYHYTAPGLGGAMGAVSGETQRLLYQGLFLAPHITLQALKSAAYASALFSRLGYDVFPKENDFRGDIIQSIELKTIEALLTFCQSIQENSPVDAHVTLLPGLMPGYKDKVIMAAGTFIQGASIELSADGPVRPPYTVYIQGGLTFEHSVLAFLATAEKLACQNN